MYCASKAAVHSLSDTMRMELQGTYILSYLLPLSDDMQSGFGVKVMCVAPGAIKSGIGAANDSKTFLKPGTSLTRPLFDSD